jgi:polyhydroxybutyrate depolymerase
MSYRYLLAMLLVFAAGCHLLRAPKRHAPRLSAGVHKGALHLEGLDRSYLLYVPERRRAKPPLLVLLHGSRQTAEDLRRATGHAFEQLADQKGFVAVYPEGYARRWNDCRAEGRYRARKLGIDDVQFLLALIAELEKRAGIDQRRVFFAGYSSGGQLAFRMALERPERVTGITAFAANLPTDQNWLCEAVGKPVPVLLVNGTDDPINPFAGGKVSVFGFASRGKVRSALASVEYFAALAGLTECLHSRSGTDENAGLETWHWQEVGAPEVMLVAVQGGGHVIPGKRAAYPRILGQVSPAIDGPEAAWQFFARQRSLRD